MRLLKTLDVVADVVVSDENVLDHDRNCRLTSLPGLFGTTAETVPAATPDPAPQVAGRRAWRERLGAARALRIGLCWQGNPAHRDDRRRSFPLEALDRLCGIRDVQFVAMRVTDEPTPADWRWMLDRSDTPWYPSMRLVRQPRADDWQAVAPEVERELVSMAKEAVRA